MESIKTLKKMSRAARKRWRNPSYRENQTLAISLGMKKRWSIPGGREKLIAAAKNKFVNHPELLNKLRESISGDKNPRWSGGIHTPYGPGFNQSLREIIKKRDDYLCQNPKCYLPENGRAHDIHHIDRSKHHNDPVNLITLCRKCHMVADRKDWDYWTEYYQSLQFIRGIKTGLEKAPENDKE